MTRSEICSTTQDPVLQEKTMFRNAVHATRPIVLAARASLRPSASAARAFSTTTRVLSGGPPPPQLYGEGAKPGTVPTDLEQATGLERLQLLGDMEGIKVFDDSPLDSTHLGTKVNPVLVPSYVSFAWHSNSAIFLFFGLTMFLRMWNALLDARVFLLTLMTFFGSR